MKRQTRQNDVMGVRYMQKIKWMLMGLFIMLLGNTLTAFEDTYAPAIGCFAVVPLGAFIFIRNFFRKEK